MNAPDAIKELGLLLGHPELALGEDGTCRLSFDKRLDVDFELLNDGRTLHLSSAVSILELEDEESLEKLLKANLLGTETGGAFFSLSPEGEVLFEQRLRMDGLDLTGFSQAVESFVNHLDGWEERLTNGELNASATAFANA